MKKGVRQKKHTVDLKQPEMDPMIHPSCGLNEVFGAYCAREEPWWHQVSFCGASFNDSWNDTMEKLPRKVWSIPKSGFNAGNYLSKYKVYCKSGTFFLLEVMAQRGCSKKREEDLPWNWRSRGVVKCSTPVLVHGLVYRILSISFLPHLSTHIFVVIFVLANPFKQETSRTKSSFFFNLDRMMLAFMVVNPTWNTHDNHLNMIRASDWNGLPTVIQILPGKLIQHHLWLMCQTYPTLSSSNFLAMFYGNEITFHVFLWILLLTVCFFGLQVFNLAFEAPLSQ